MTDNMTTSVDATFLIVVRNMVIGQDLAETIADDHPQARIIIVSTMEEALVSLTDVATLELTFIEAEPSVLEGSPLAPALAARGGKVLLMNPRTERARAPSRWKVLHFPFTTEDVRSLMAAH